MKRKMNIANQKIHICYDEFILKNGDKEIKVTGTIEYVWFPEPASKLSCKVKDKVDSYNDVTGNFELIRHSLKIGDYKWRSVSNEAFPSLEGRINNLILGDNTIPTSSIRFSIINLKEIGPNRVERKKERWE